MIRADGYDVNLFRSLARSPRQIKSRVARKALRLLAVLLACAVLAPGQRAVYELFGVERGLTNLSITAWAQDKRGLIWVGTERGLFHFDGSQFRRYGEEDGLPNELVMGLGTGPDGTLWVSTFGGLVFKRSARFEKPTDAQLSGPLTAQAVAFRAGKAYFATRSGVAYGDWPSGKDGLRVQLLPVPAEKKSKFAKAVAVGPDGEVWWACGLGLCRYAGKELERFGVAEGVPEDDYYSLLFDRKGRVWARSRDHLLGRNSAGRFERQGGPNVGPTRAGYAQISQDSDGRILVGSMKGLAIQDNGGWSLLNANNGLPVSGVAGAWADREGALWIALSGAGLARMPGYSEWTSFSQPDGLTGDVVNGLAQSADGHIWVATPAGLSIASRVGRDWVWRSVRVPGMDVVHNLSQAWDGSLFVTGNSAVVMRLDPSTRRWTSYGRVVGVAYNALLDRKGRVWVSTDRGLFRSQGKSTALERIDGSIPRNEKATPRVMKFIGAALGRGEDEVWISTYSGLLHYLDGRWRWLTDDEGLRSLALNAPAVDPQGRVWVGHRDVGGASLVEFKGGGYTVRTVDGAKGLGEELMYTFHFPRAGGTWALTSNGVQVLKDNSWIRLDRSDGLLWDECSQGAFLSAWDGSYWIGTSRGVSRFAPRAELRATTPPMAQITEARWGKTLVEPEQGKKLQVDGRTVQIRFAALGFRHAALNRFRYRVDNRDWVETTERSLNLEHLAAGPHTVEVKAGNVESGWNETAEVVEFEVAARWHELWWVRLLILFGSLALVMVVWRLRNRRLESARKALERAVEVRTDQLRLEKQKVVEQHAQIGQLLKKAIEASRLKSEFLANMSHEIRTPMNAILGLMSLTLDSDLDEKQREQLDGARSAAVSLLGVLTDILDLSKIEAGRFEISPAPFDLHAQLSSVHTLFAHEADAKGLQLEVQIGADVPVWVEGDKDRLRQVLVNLMSNAVKFTDKGKVTLQARAMPPRGGHQEISIVVEDTGIGIAGQHREMIFEGFRQADGSITRRFGGTGLGLAITKKILNAMGGRIEMESELGRGTRFTVVIDMPVVVREAPGDKPVPQGEPVGERLRILVAEDNILNQKVAQRVLEKRGHEVVLATTGLLALDAMTRQEFDVVVMDLQMPEMDGIEATRRMRTGSSRTSGVPVLGFTASALPEDRDACMAAGMNGLVNKPVEPRLFVSEVERLGAQSRRKSGKPNE